MADEKIKNSPFEGIEMSEQDDIEGESLTHPGKAGSNSTVLYADPIGDKLLEI